MARLRRLPLALVAAVAVASGCGGTTEAGSGGADVVPASAVAYLSVNTDTSSSQWKTLAGLAKKFPDEQHALDAVRQAAGKQGVDFEHDLKPALGPELDLAWLDLENDGQNFVFLVQPDDTSKFEALLKKNGAQSGVISEQVGDWEVVAKSREVIARFKRESEAGPVLADDATFKDAMDSYPDDSLLRAFVDGKPVMDAVHKFASGSGDLDKLGSLDWIAANIRVTDDGVRFDTNVHGTAGPMLKNVMTGKSFTSSLARKVPSDALLFVTFHGAKGMFGALENNPVFGQTPELKEYAGMLRQVESLLQGEDAFYVRPGSGKIPEITLVTEPARGDERRGRSRPHPRQESPPAPGTAEAHADRRRPCAHDPARAGRHPLRPGRQEPRDHRLARRDRGAQGQRPVPRPQRRLQGRGQVLRDAGADAGLRLRQLQGRPRVRRAAVPDADSGRASSGISGRFDRRSSTR